MLTKGIIAITSFVNEVYRAKHRFIINWVWFIPLLLALERWRHKDGIEFKAILGFKVSKNKKQSKFLSEGYLSVIVTLER